MTSDQPAQLPSPPYVAVIFSSLRMPGGAEEYGATADRMVELARTMPGFLGVESVRGADGFGITVAYFTDEDAVRRWREHPEHREAQRRGRAEWYERFELRFCRVERAYGFKRGDGTTAVQSDR